MDPTAIDAAARFSEACGGGTFQLEIIDPDGPARVVRTFAQPFLVVGRSPDSDLVLDHEEVSWRHCYLQRLGGCLVCIDLSSQNGVFIDREPQRVGWIRPGQSLHVGPVGLRFLCAASDMAREANGDDPSRLHPFSAQYARDLPPAALEIEGTGGSRYGWRMSRALALVGRSSSCQVRLVDERVSKFHAALVRTHGGVWVVDLLSRMGVVVGGEMTRAARLDEGESCQLGPFTVRHYRETLAPAPPRRTRSLPARIEPRAARLEPATAHGPTLSAPGGWSVEQPAGPDAYHQAVMTLAQMLGAMHNDHMNLVRDELAQIRRLAEEMHALREEIGQKPADAPALAGPAGAVGPAPVAAAPHPAAFDAALGAMAAAGIIPGENALGTDPPLRRDPKECLAIASSFLASYEQKQNGQWNRILRLLANLTRTPDPARGPLGQAPLG